MKNITINKYRTWTKLTGVLALAGVLVTACNDDFTSPESPSGSTITAVATGSADFNILTAALTKTNQAASLNNNNSGTFTVFAPHDSAFIAYFQGRLLKPTTFNEDSVLQYINTKMSTTSTITISALSSVLTYHIISSNLPKSALTGRQTFATLNGARLSISLQGTQVKLNANTPANGSKVIAFDVAASNGVIHTVNRVLVPVTTASVASLLGLTVSYATNPPTVTVGATSGNNYDVFAAAIKKAGVASSILPNVSPLPELTVFAPTDAAFTSFLNVGTEAAAITAINAMDATTLANIVNYHIIPTVRVLTTDMTDGGTLQAVSGVITSHISGTTYKLSDTNTDSADATITSPNNLTNAGGLHGIDVVLRP